MKKLIKVVAILVVLILIVAVALPFVIDVDRFRPQIETSLSDSLGRKVQVGHMDLAVLAGTLKAADISIADDPAFSSAPFLKAKSFEVGIELYPLIVSRDLRIRGLTFDEPQVVLLHASSGRWNFSSLGQGAKEPQSASLAAPSAPHELTVAKLKISNGSMTVGGPSGARQTYDHVNLTAENLSSTSSFPFTLDAATPGGGSLKVTGQAGPIGKRDAAETPFQAKVALKKFDLNSTGFLNPSSGISGIVDYEGEVRSDGKVAHSEGTAKVQNLRAVKTGTPANQPVAVRYASDYDLAKQSGVLTKGEVFTGKSIVALSGTYDAHPESTVVHMKLNAPSIPVGDIEALLPAVGVTLPAGSTLQGGTLTTNLQLDGAVDKLVTSGDVNLSNAKLAGFGLGSKLGALALFTGVRASPDTVIETMSSGLHISPEGIRSESLKLVIADLGTITGAGTIGENGALDFKLLANVASTGVGGALANLASRYGVGTALAKGIPFLVQGTTSKPSFLPDTNAMLKPGTANQGGAAGAAPPKNLGDVLGGFFGQKKQQ